MALKKAGWTDSVWHRSKDGSRIVRVGRRSGKYSHAPRCTTVLDRRRGHKQKCWNRLPLGQSIGPCATCAEILAARHVA